MKFTSIAFASILAPCASSATANPKVSRDTTERTGAAAGVLNPKVSRGTAERTGAATLIRSQRDDVLDVRGVGIDGAIAVGGIGMDPDGTANILQRDGVLDVRNVGIDGAIAIGGIGIDPDGTSNVADGVGVIAFGGSAHGVGISSPPGISGLL